MRNIKVIAFAGKKQTGKDTAKDYMVSKLDNFDIQHLSFARPLKDMCRNIFGLTYEQCFGTDADKNTLTNLVHPVDKTPLTARQVLQIVGTDMFRSMYENVWVDKMTRDINTSLTTGLNTMPSADYVFITDARFPNEVDALMARDDALVIKMERINYQKNDEHISEKALDHLPDSYYNTIIRARSVDDIYKECDKLILKIQNPQLSV